MAEVQPLTKANLLEFLRSQNITIKSTKLPVEPSDPDSLELDTSFDFYEFLGIDENVSRDVVIGAYQAMCKFLFSMACLSGIEGNILTSPREAFLPRVNTGNEKACVRETPGPSKSSR